jgi:hypothetical protein
VSQGTFRRSISGRFCHFRFPTFTPPFHLEPEACYTPSLAVAALTPYGLGAMALVLAFGAYVFGTRRLATVDID